MAFIIMVFAPGRAIDVQTAHTENTFLTPSGFFLKPIDDRPKVYNVFSDGGEILGKFASLYQGIDFAINSKGGYIENSLNPGKKLFFLTDSPQCFYYKDGAKLDDIISWESADLIAPKDSICVVSPPVCAGYHAYKSAENISYINPNLDAYIIQELEGDAIKIDLSRSKLYPSKSQTVYAKVGFVILIDRFAYFSGLVCDANSGDWYYCFDYLDKTTIDSARCVLLSDYTKGHFAPKDDLEMSIQSLAFSDAGENYVKNVINLEFSKGRKYAFENALVGKDCKIYFITALDIQSSGVPDYMNGARWENIIIKSLESEKSLIYNTAATKLNDSILNISYAFESSEVVYSGRIADIQNAFKVLDKSKNIQTIQEAIKSYNALPNFLRSLIDAQTLYQAKDELYNHYSGLEKAKLIAQGLKPALEADNGYIIDNYHYICEAWDILYNKTSEEERENFSQYHKTKIDFYYNKAANLYAQATDALTAIENAKSDRQIVEAYLKYVTLDEAQKQKILGKKLRAEFEKKLSKIDAQVLKVSSQIQELGRREPADYPVVYGVNNYQKMKDLINNYERLSNSQKNLIPSSLRKIYAAASKYFLSQVNILKTLKERIEKNQPSREEVAEWVNYYKKLDIASKWRFKNDSQFGQYYEKLEIYAAVYEIPLN
ncbi:MAG TPA: hypothetical protein VIL24_02615 [Clostridia bacterium]